MSFLTGQDRTPGFACLKIQELKKKCRKKKLKKKNVLIQASVKENVWYPDSPEFVNFQDFRTGGNVQKSPKVTYTETWVW